MTNKTLVWRIFTIFLKQSGFYYTFQPKIEGFNSKFSYHPKKDGKDGTLIHTKTDEPNQKSKVMFSKKGWPDLLNIKVAPIDTLGFSTIDFINKDPFLDRLLKTEIESPNVTFTILENHTDFSLRMHLCKTELFSTEKDVIGDRIEIYEPEELIDRQIHHFKPIKIDGEAHGFSLIADYVSVPPYS